MAVRKKRKPPRTSTPVLVSSEYCIAVYCTYKHEDKY
jgi:hypothetical protein